MPRREFPLLHLVPTELRGVLLDFVWDADRLRELDLPTRTVPVSDLDWHLDLPFWSVDDLPFQVTPRQVAAEAHRFSAQYERTLAADLRFPLDVVERTDRLTILDGVHRLLKAVMIGRDRIAVRVLPWHRVDDIAG
jgi:hypothetical protein